MNKSFFVEAKRNYYSGFIKLLDKFEGKYYFDYGNVLGYFSAVLTPDCKSIGFLCDTVVWGLEGNK